MDLKRIALWKANQPMDGWDPVTETWVPNAFLARIDLTDRFLSNFNRPTRMRMLFSADDTVFPESRVFRHPVTLDVYILGTTRKDTIDGSPTVALTLCRLATDTPGGTAGYATITRKVVMGPPNDPGWLVDTVLAKSWIDTEFLSSSQEPGTTDLQIERYNAFLPLSVQPREWDFITLHGVRHRVVDTFADSGLFALRIDHEDDYRKDFYLLVQGKRVVDRSTQQYVQEQARSYQVTGMVKGANDFALWATDSDTYVDVYFEREHLPFVPDVSNSQMWLSIDGVKREVKSVTSQSGERQFSLRCM